MGDYSMVAAAATASIPLLSSRDSAKASRIYLSARVFANFGKVLKYVAHELGHFETNSLFERNAELKASSIRRKAHRACA